MFFDTILITIIVVLYFLGGAVRAIKWIKPGTRFFYLRALILIIFWGPIEIISWVLGVRV